MSGERYPYGSTYDPFMGLLQNADSEPTRRIAQALLGAKSTNRFQSPEAATEFDGISRSLDPSGLSGSSDPYSTTNLRPRNASSYSAGFGSSPESGPVYQFDNGGVPPHKSGHSGLAQLLSSRAATSAAPIGFSGSTGNTGDSPMSYLDRLDREAGELSNRKSKLEDDLLEKQLGNYEEDRRREMILRALGAIA